MINTLIVGFGEVDRRVASWLESIGMLIDCGNYFILTDGTTNDDLERLIR